MVLPKFSYISTLFLGSCIEVRLAKFILYNEFYLCKLCFDIL